MPRRHGSDPGGTQRLQTEPSSMGSWGAGASQLFALAHMLPAADCSWPPANRDCGIGASAAGG
eukprot:3863591-Pyramimonas_sp.AAC.1